MQVREYLKQWMLSKISEESNLHHLIVLWSQLQDILRLITNTRNNFCHHTPEEQMEGRGGGWSGTSMFYCEVDVLKEKHFCIKFCCKLVNSSIEMYWMQQQAFRDRALRQFLTLEQYRHFKNGCTCDQNSRWCRLLSLTRRVWYSTFEMWWHTRRKQIWSFSETDESI